MPKCSFCKANYNLPYGLTYVLIDGTVMHFCSSKCRKNFDLGRKNKKVKWVTKMKNTEVSDEETKE
jgi:large subunit ribosomal protein L24e